MQGPLPGWYISCASEADARLDVEIVDHCNCSHFGGQLSQQLQRDIPDDMFRVGISKSILNLGAAGQD